MDHPECPRCGQAGIEVWTLWVKTELTCNRCGWGVTVPESEATRPLWHALIIRGVRRLRTEYGMLLPAGTTQGYFAADDPQLGWNAVSDFLLQSAVARLHLPMLLPIPEWHARKSAAESAEWAELRAWLWDAFAPLVLPAEQAA